MKYDYHPTSVGPNATASLLLGILQFLAFLVVLLIVIHRGVWRRVVRHIPTRNASVNQSGTTASSSSTNHDGPVVFGHPDYPISADLFR